MIGPPAKRWGPTLNDGLVFRGSGPVLLRNPSCDFSGGGGGGGGGPDPLPLWIRACPLSMKFIMLVNVNKPTIVGI